MFTLPCDLGQPHLSDKLLVLFQCVGVLFLRFQQFIFDMSYITGWPQLKKKSFPISDWIETTLACKRNVYQPYWYRTIPYPSACTRC